MSQSTFSRRQFCRAAALAPIALTLLPKRVSAMDYGTRQPTLELVAQSPTHLWNGFVKTHSGRMFAGMPRWPGYEETPSLVEIMRDGSLVPYPGGTWNDWKPGASAPDRFIDINALHSADGVSLWAVDQGAAPGGDGQIKGAQKLVQIDTLTNKVVRNLTFGPDVMPKGAQFNDIRIHGSWAYLTDSGLGAIIVVDLHSGKGLRRLAGDPSVLQNRPKVGHANRWMVLPDGRPQITNADPIELSPDGEWLYYQPASGPMHRVPTAALRDTSLSEAALHDKIEFVYDTDTMGGTAMDSNGNIFLAEADKPRVTVLAPDGSMRVLIEDDRLWGSDALFIDSDRYLYLPVSQVPNLQFLQGPHGKDLVTLPFKIWRLKLPDIYGNAIPT